MPSGEVRTLYDVAYPAPQTTVTRSTGRVLPRSTCNCWGFPVPLCQTVPAVQSTALAAAAPFDDAVAGRPQARSGAAAPAGDPPSSPVASRAAVATAATAARPALVVVCDTSVLRQQALNPMRQFVGGFHAEPSKVPTNPKVTLPPAGIRALYSRLFAVTSVSVKLSLAVLVTRASQYEPTS